MNGSTIGTRPVRVLHLRDSPWVDGPGRTILESAERFDQRRIEYRAAVLVGHLGTEHPMIVAARSRGVAIHAIEDRGGIDASIVAGITSLIDQFDIDILHASDVRTSIYCIFAHWLRPRVAIVRTTHGWIANSLRRRAMRLLDKALLRVFDHVTLVSSAMRELVPRWWLPDSRVTVVHNALPLDTYGRAYGHVDRLAPDPAVRVILLNVGRLSPEKGQDLLIRAVARLTEDYPGLHLRFAGIGGMEADLKALVNELGVSERVEFLGYVQNMPRLYAEADLVVQSSLTEGLPNVILEAAYLGIPVLATDVGGTREVIEHGQGGWLVRPGSVDEIVGGLRRYLVDPSSYLRMTQFARSSVQQKFSFETRVEKMMCLYERVAWR